MKNIIFFLITFFILLSFQNLKSQDIVQSQGCTIDTKDVIINFHRAGRFWRNLFYDERDRIFRDELYQTLEFGIKTSLKTRAINYCDSIKTLYDLINTEKWVDKNKVSIRKASYETARAILAYLLNCKCGGNTHKDDDSTIIRLFRDANTLYKKVKKHTRDYVLLASVCEGTGGALNQEWYELHMRLSAECQKKSTTKFVRNMADKTEIQAISPNTSGEIELYVDFDLAFPISKVSMQAYNQVGIEEIRFFQYNSDDIIGYKNGCFKITLVDKGYKGVRVFLHQPETPIINEGREKYIEIRKGSGFLRAAFWTKKISGEFIYDKKVKERDGKIEFMIQVETSTQIKSKKLYVLDKDKNNIGMGGELTNSLVFNNGGIEMKSEDIVYFTASNPSAKYIRLELENSTEILTLDLEIIKTEIKFVKTTDNTQIVDCFPLDENYTNYASVSLLVNTSEKITPKNIYFVYYNDNGETEQIFNFVGNTTSLIGNKPNIQVNQILYINSDPKWKGIEFGIKGSEGIVTSKRIPFCIEFDTIPIPEIVLPGALIINSNALKSAVQSKLEADGLKNPCEMSFIGNLYQGYEVGLVPSCGNVAMYQDDYASGNYQDSNINQLVQTLFQTVDNYLPTYKGIKLTMGNDLLELTGVVCGYTDAEQVKLIRYTGKYVGQSIDYVHYPINIPMLFQTAPNYKQLVGLLSPSSPLSQGKWNIQDAKHNIELGVLRSDPIARIISKLKNPTEENVINQIKIITKEYPLTGGQFRGIWLKVTLKLVNSTK